MVEAYHVRFVGTGVPWARTAASYGSGWNDLGFR